MNNLDSKIDSNDVLFVIADDKDETAIDNVGTDLPQIVANAVTANPVSIQVPKCFCTNDQSSENDSSFANPWENMRGLTQNQAPKCADIFMGNVDCSMDVPCCCGLRPKTAQRKTSVAKGISTKRNLPKTVRKPQHPSAIAGCQSCAQSRKYLDYLSKTLATLRQMGAGISGSCPKESRNPAPQKRRKRRTRKASMPPLPRCSCPAPCGTLDVHTKCLDDIDIVPKDMGWNWKLNSNQRKGWRPGAIPRSVRELMCHFLKPCPCDTLPVGALTGGDASSADPACIDHGAQQAPLPQRPMIKVQRKNDEYVITMNPLKSARLLKTEPDPYMNCDPIHVRITANREDQRMAQIKQIIRDSGFRRCKCGRAVAQCTCRDNREMEALRTCVENCGTKYGIADLGEKLSLNRLKDLELEFTPPAAVVKSCLRPVPECALQETQYNENDLKQKVGGSGSSDKGGKGGKAGKGGKGGDGGGKGGEDKKRGADKKGNKKGDGSANSSQTSLTNTGKRRRPGTGDSDRGTGKSSKDKGRGGRDEKNRDDGSDYSLDAKQRRKPSKGKKNDGKSNGGRDGNKKDGGSVDSLGRNPSKGKSKDGKSRGGRDGNKKDGGSVDSFNKKPSKGKKNDGKSNGGREGNKKDGGSVDSLGRNPSKGKSKDGKSRGGRDGNKKDGGSVDSFNKKPSKGKNNDGTTRGGRDGNKQDGGSVDSLGRKPSKGQNDRKPRGDRDDNDRDGRRPIQRGGRSDSDTGKDMERHRTNGETSYSLDADQKRKHGRKGSKTTSEWLALINKLQQTMEPKRCCMPCPGRYDMSQPRLCCCCKSCLKGSSACVPLECSTCSYLWPPWTPDQQSRSSCNVDKYYENRVRGGCSW